MASVRRQVRLVPRPATGTLEDVPDRPLLPAFVVLWSSGYVVGAMAIDVADPLPLLAARFLLAALLAVPLALRHGRWRGAPLGRLAVVGAPAAGRPVRRRLRRLRARRPGRARALVMLGLSPLVTSAIAVGTATNAATRASGPAWRSASSGSRSASRPSSATPASVSASA